VAALADEIRSTRVSEYGTAVKSVTPLTADSNRPPIFCMSAPGINSVGYIKLGRSMGPQQPLFVLQSQYRTNENLPFSVSEIEGMAAENRRAVRDIWPDGPFCLGGMCEGAHIAFEMARQLQQEGKSAPILFSFDAYPEQNSRSRIGFWR